MRSINSKGKSQRNEDLLPSSDFFRRSTETSSDIVDFSAGSGGDRFERSFQTFGCLVSRQGRLFVKSHNREDQGREVALLMSEQTGAGTADGASPISSSIGVVGVGRTGTVLSQTAAGSVEERGLTEENASQSPLVRAGKKGYRHRVRSQSPFFLKLLRSLWRKGD